MHSDTSSVRSTLCSSRDSVASWPSVRYCVRHKKEITRRYIPNFKRTTLSRVRENYPSNYMSRIPRYSQLPEQKRGILHRGPPGISPNKHGARKGKLVAVFRNGDPHFKPLTVCISTKTFPTIDSLLTYLTTKIPTTAGVRHIFRLSDDRELINMDEFVDGEAYVASSTRRVNRDVPYGSNTERYWHNRPPSARKFRRGEEMLIMDGSKFEDTNDTETVSSSQSHPYGGTGWKPLPHKPSQTSRLGGRQTGPGYPLNTMRQGRNIVIMSNTNRLSQERVFINPSARQNFEDMLMDFTNLLHLQQPPVQTLYTAEPPHRRVCSYSQLFRDFREHDRFIACGIEFLPLELKLSQAKPPPPALATTNHNKRSAPQSSSTSSGPNIDPVPFHRSPSPPHENNLPELPNINAPLFPDNYLDDYVDHDPVPPYPKSPSPTPPLPMPPPTLKEFRRRERMPRKLPRHDNSAQTDTPKQPPRQTTACQTLVSGSPPPPIPPRTNGHKPPPVKRESHSPPTHQWNERPNGHKSRPVKRESPSPPTHQWNERYEEDIIPNEDNEQHVEPITCDIKGKTKAFWPPSVPEKFSTKLPNKQHQLDWIYGYNGDMDGGGLQVLSNGDLVYSMGKVVVMYSSAKSRQRHYLEHTSRITCLALHPSKLYIASGQERNQRTGSKASVRIWDCDNLSTYCVLGEDIFTLSIVSMDFSKESSGEYLLVLDGCQGSHRQCLHVMDWHNRVAVGRTKTSRDQVKCARFHPDDDLTLVTLGRRHVHFWRMFWLTDDRPIAVSGGSGDVLSSGQEGKRPNIIGGTRILRDKKSGLFQDYVPEEVFSVTFDLVGNVVTGDSNGCIQIWVRDDDDAYVCRSVGHLQHAHQTGITGLLLIGDGTLLSAADNVIKAWDTLADYSFLKEKTLKGSWGRIRALTCSHPENLDGSLLVGTERSCLLEGSLQEPFRPLLQQHCARVIAVAAHPSEHSMVTAAADCMICKWSALQHKVIWVSSTEKPCTCVAYHPRGNILVVGTNAGRFVVLNDLDGIHVMSCQINTFEHPIGTLKFSHDGEFLALGCEDGNVYIYIVQDTGIVYRKWGEGTLKGHSTPVQSIDWAENSYNIRTQSEDEQIKYWDVKNMCYQLDGFGLRDIKFLTHNCFFSYQVMGIWKSRSEHDITTLSRSNCGDKIAIGDASGTISVYNYPTIYKQSAQFHTSHVHSSWVDHVTFIFDDSYLLSSAAESPSALIQWSLVDNHH